jgi:hypothetical protein
MAVMIFIRETPKACSSREDLGWVDGTSHEYFEAP